MTENNPQKIIKAVIQARMGSTRLKGKSLYNFSGKPLLQIIIDRLRLCKNLDKIIVATSNNSEDDKIFELCQSLNIDTVRGSIDDVLSRYVIADTLYFSDYTVRATGDNPFISFEHIDKLIEFAVTLNLDYSAIQGLPLGMAAEIYKSQLSKVIYNAENIKSYHKEHVTPYFYENPVKFNIQYLKIDCPNKFRLTVDCEEDAEIIKQMINDLNEIQTPATFEKIINYCLANQTLFEKNKNIIQRIYNEKY